MNLVNLSSLTHGDFKDRSAVSALPLILYKFGGLPRGSPPTLIPPLRVVCLESPSSQGLPNFGRWPPRTPNWEILVEVPAQPASPFLQALTPPQWAVAGIVAANGGQWRTRLQLPSAKEASIRQVHPRAVSQHPDD